MMEPDDNWYMKASFDKANRTSLHSGRGPGLEYAKEVWREAKQLYPKLQLTTDIHECWQAEQLAGLIDVVQIPAFLSRQTDLIVEAAKHFPIVNIKKGQWLGPDSLVHSAEKVKETNPNCETWICDRGSNFGYHELFVNFGIVDTLKQYYDRVILDCTHATQRARLVYGTQGDPVLAGRYLVAADLFNYDGVFAETHPRPGEAVSDGENVIPLCDLESLINKAKRVGTL
jgi:2-dehydro-3-deoxyphosphooctonate aldolase (KDO 8-P synthase)